MSQIALTPNESGTGTFSIASPNSNTNRTLTLPDETGTMLTSVSTVSSTQIAGALNATGSAPIYACRAWVNFNGTGTVAIRGSGNVSSITDNGVGDYTVNFTTAMPDANYSAVVTNVGLVASDTRRNSVIAGAEGTGATTMTTSAVRINVGNPASTSLSDNAVMNVNIFR